TIPAILPCRKPGTSKSWSSGRSDLYFQRVSVIPAIEVSGLKKAYTRKLKDPGLLGALKGLFSGRSIKVPAVTGLDFSISPGEAVGLIGENGAGKSTTVKMLTGILVPSSGNLKVLGLTPWRN